MNLSDSDLERAKYLLLIDVIEEAYYDESLLGFDIEYSSLGNWIDDARQVFNWKNNREDFEKTLSELLEVLSKRKSEK